MSEKHKILLERLERRAEEILRMALYAEAERLKRRVEVILKFFPAHRLSLVYTPGVRDPKIWVDPS